RFCVLQNFQTGSGGAPPFFDRQRGKPFEVVGNLVLASQTQLRVYQVCRIVDETQFYFLTFYNTFDVEGRLVDFVCLRAPSERVDYLVLLLHAAKLAVCRLDTFSKALKTLSLHNFENAHLHAQHFEMLPEVPSLRCEHACRYAAASVASG